MKTAAACRSCRHFKPQGFTVGTPTPGTCLWVPPPFLQRVVAMLHAEPNTAIDWMAMNAEPPEVQSDYHCSAYDKSALLKAIG